MLQWPIHASIARWLCSLCFSSRKTLRLISRTASKPSFPFLAFSEKAVTVASSTAFLTFCHPPHKAVILASCTNCVRFDPSGWYVTVSLTLMMFEKVRLWEIMVTFFDAGSTYEVSKTCDVSFPPISEFSHFGALCLHVIRRSVRSYDDVSTRDEEARVEKSIQFQWMRQRFAISCQPQ